MKDEELQEIADRCESASPPPWKAGIGQPGWQPRLVWIDGPQLGPIVPGNDLASIVQAEADISFCAHARTDVPKLVAEIARLRNLCRTYREDAEDNARVLGALRAERRSLWRFVKPEEGVPVVYVGVHVVRWYEAAGEYEPTAGFVQVAAEE